MPSATEKNPSTPEFLLLHPGERSHDIFAAIALITMLGLFRLDGLLSINSHVIGGVSGDAGLYLWLVESNLSDLPTRPWFTTQAFFPYTGTLAWSDNFILPSALIGCLRFLGLTPILSFNLVLLAAQFLNGYCTYLLARQVTGRALCAAYAGLLFFSWPFLTEHLGHPQLQFAFWLPLSLSLLLKFIARPSPAYATAWGLSVVGAFLCAVYYAIFAVLLSAIAWAILIIARREAISRPTIFQWLLGSSLGLIPILPFLWPYLDTLRPFDDRQLHEPYYFAATGLSYFSSTTFNLLYGFSHTWSHAEARLFPGITALILFGAGLYRLSDARKLRRVRNLILLLVSLVFALTHPLLDHPVWSLLAALSSWAALGAYVILLKRLSEIERSLGCSFITNRTLLGLAAGICLFFALFSLGPLGKNWQGEFALGVYRPFYEFFPGVSAARALGRVGILVMLGIALGAALGLKFLLEQKQVHPLIVLLAFPATMLEAFVTRYPVESPLPLPSSFQFLTATPKSSDALIVLPFTEPLKPDGSVERWGDFARRNVAAMLWARDFRGNLVNGYSGQRSWIMKNLPRELRTFPSDHALRALARIAGLRYILVTSDAETVSARAEETQRYERYQPALRFLNGDESGNLLFEFDPLVRLDKDFTLLVPSRGPSVLQATVFANYLADQPPIRFEVILPDYDARILSSTTLKADRQDLTLLVPIPQDLKPVTPLKIGFRAEGEHPVYLRRTRLLDTMPEDPRSRGGAATITDPG